MRRGEVGWSVKLDSASCLLGAVDETGAAEQHEKRRHRHQHHQCLTEHLLID